MRGLELYSRTQHTDGFWSLTANATPLLPTIASMAMLGLLHAFTFSGLCKMGLVRLLGLMHSQILHSREHNQ